MNTVKKYFDEAKASDMLTVSVHDGAHRFSESNEHIDRFLGVLSGKK